MSTRTLVIVCSLAFACGTSDSTEPPAAETPPPEPTAPEPATAEPEPEPAQPAPEPEQPAAEARVPADWQRVEGEAYSFAVPPGWEVQDRDGLAGQKSASGGGDVTCATFNEEAPAGNAPLAERVRAHVVGDVLAGVENLMGESTEVDVGGQPGIESRYRQSGAGDTIRRTVEHEGHWLGIECAKSGDEPLGEMQATVEGIVASYALAAN